MGMLFIGQPCDQCGYQSRHLLRYHLGSMGLFMGIVTCQTCADLVSLFPSYDSIPDDISATLGGMARYVARANALASRHADLFPTGIMAFDVCLVCGGQAIYHHHIWQPRYNAGGHIGLPCPRCADGQVRLLPAGTWD